MNLYRIQRTDGLFWDGRGKWMAVGKFYVSVKNAHIAITTHNLDVKNTITIIEYETKEIGGYVAP